MQNRFYSFVFIILLLGGCQLLETSSPDLVIKVDADIEINMREHLDSNGSDGFYFALTSSDTTDCAGLEYQYQYAIQRNSLEFNITGLKNPTDCSGESYHVKSDVLLSPGNGTYQVRFAIGEDIKNKGTLFINDEQIQLNISEPFGLAIPHGILYRIPEGIVWGYIAGDQDLEAADAWLRDTFQAYGKLPELQPGFYGYFELIGENQEVNLFFEPEAENYLPFVYQLEREENSLPELISQFQDQFEAQMQLSCTTWTGQEFE